MTDQEKRQLRRLALRDQELLFPNMSLCDICLSLRDGIDPMPEETVKKTMIFLCRIKDSWEDRHGGVWKKAMDFAILNLIVATIKLAEEHLMQSSSV